jgi:hypothetical protein
MLKPRSFFVCAVAATLVSIFANAGQAGQANAPGSAGPGSADHAQEIQKEYDHDTQQIQEVSRSLGKMIPLAGQASPNPSGSGATGLGLTAGLSSASIPPELQTQFERVRELMDQPWMQKYLKVLSDPNVERDFLALLSHPQRVSFLFWELSWLVFILIVKIWRTMKAKKILSILFVQVWTYSLLFIGLFFLIPRLVFGTAYADLIHSVLSALKL